jgi:hypothetical protein
MILVFPLAARGTMRSAVFVLPCGRGGWRARFWQIVCLTVRGAVASVVGLFGWPGLGALCRVGRCGHGGQPATWLLETVWIGASFATGVVVLIAFVVAVVLG